MDEAIKKLIRAEIKAVLDELAGDLLEKSGGMYHNDRATDSAIDIVANSFRNFYFEDDLSSST